MPRQLAGTAQPSYRHRSLHLVRPHHSRFSRHRTPHHSGWILLVCGAAAPRPIEFSLHGIPAIRGDHRHPSCGQAAVVSGQISCRTKARATIETALGPGHRHLQARGCAPAQQLLRPPTDCLMMHHDQPLPEHKRNGAPAGSLYKSRSYSIGCCCAFLQHTATTKAIPAQSYGRTAAGTGR